MVHITAKQYEKICKYKRIIDKHRQNLINAQQNKNIDGCAKERSLVDFYTNEYFNYINDVMSPNRFTPINPPNSTTHPTPSIHPTPSTYRILPTEETLTYHNNLMSQLYNNELTYTVS